MEVIGSGSWAAVLRVRNTKRRFGQVGDKGYAYLKTIDGQDYLFAPSELARAKARAQQNPEDVAGWRELLPAVGKGEP